VSTADDRATLLRALDDAEWHQLREIADYVGEPWAQVRTDLRELARTGLLEHRISPAGPGEARPRSDWRIPSGGTA